MITLVEELNQSLQKLLDDILNKKNEIENILTKINEKINEKIDEAKQYKKEVDNVKLQINILEDEIKSLEADLTDLKEKFGKKNHTAIIEAGNIEINAKIVEKQKIITKHRQKISELTEKARSIKDLLMNLKKDKILKEDKLDNYVKVYKYYNESLTRIIEHTKNNPNNLTIRENNYNYLKTKFNREEPTTEVFEEIESIDNDLNKIKEKVKEKNNQEESYEDKDEFLERLKKASFELEELEKNIDLNYNDVFEKDENANPSLEDEKETEPIEEAIELAPVDIPVEEIKEEKINILNVFDNDVSKADIKEVPDIFGNNKISEKELNESTLNIKDFFEKYGIDFNRFDNKKQEELKNAFSPKMFEEIIKVLVNNNIDLSNIYNASNILIETSPIELDKIISKLLLAGQSTTNISFVLNSLSSISSDDLNNVVSSYGTDIKDANITDLIIKARRSE
ncbi:MAG: hypothetical protein PHD03_03380 [Bacilli bacterium]|nr:hypothetical protein [Bacilli bacterium]